MGLGELELGRGRGQGQVGGVGEVQRDPAVVAGQRRRGRARAPRRWRSARRAGPGCSRPTRAGQHQRLQGAGRHDGTGQLLDGAHQALARRAGRRRRPATAGRNRARSTAGDRLDLGAQGRQRAAPQRAAAPRRRRSRGRARRRRSRWAAARPRRPGRRRPAGAGRRWRRPGRRPHQAATSWRGERAVGAGVAARPGRRAGRGPARGRPAGTPTGREQRRARRAGGRRPRWRPSAPRRRPGPGSAGGRPRGRPARRRPRWRSVPSTARGHDRRRAGSGPSTRSRSATSSASRQRALGREPLQLGLGAGDLASGSSRSRSAAPSPRPSSSASRVGSSDEGGGAPLGQRRVALVEELGDVAEHQATGRTATGWASRRRRAVTARDPISRISSARPGTSKTSWTHSRTVSRTIGKEAYWLATSSSWAARCRCCHSGWRRSGRRRGSSSARAAHSRNRAANRADPPISRGDQVVHVVGVEARPASSSSAPTPRAGAVVELEVGQPEDDAVVAVHRLHVDAEPLAHPGRHAQRPRRVHLRRRTASARPPASRRARRGTARRRWCGRRARGRWPRAAPRGRRAGCRRPTRRGRRRVTRSRAWPGVSADDLADERARRRGPARPAGPAGRPSRTAACPGWPGRRRDQHPVVGDVLDPPGATCRG